MNEALEIVLEDLQKDDAVDLILHFLSRSEVILEINSTNEISVEKRSAISKEEINAFISNEGDVAFLFRVKGLSFECKKISSSLIRLVKYCDKYDVDFSFYLEKGDEAFVLMSDLCIEVKQLARKYNPKSILGGLEPAGDIATQHFCALNHGGGW